MKRVLGILSVVLLFVAVLSTSAFAAQYYTVTDLGTLGYSPPESGATGINNAGQVVGWTYGPEYHPHAFLWTADDGMIDLGARGATAINNLGQVVGYTSTGQPFLYSDGTMTTIESSGTAQAINESGQVVGNGPPFLYDSGTTTYLNSEGVLDANGINNSGDIVGVTDTNHPFLYQRGNLIDLGGIIGNDGIPFAINNSDQVVGTTNYFIGHAFLYQSGNVIDLQPTSSNFSQANAINDSGEVVGWIGPWYSNTRAFIWTKASGMVDLNTLIDPSSGWILQDATGINDKGQIVGTGIGPDGPHAFLLTLTKVPVSEKTNDQWISSANSQGASSNSNGQGSNGKK